MAASILSLYRSKQRWPAGGWLFSHAMCFKAPYFTSIADRWHLTNHIGTVHAIALCNQAKLTAGLMTDASLLPSTH